MTRPALKIDTALRVLPDVDDLAPLREALLGASREDGEQAWSAAAAYATLDTRLVDVGTLETQIAAVAERVRARVEAVARHAVAALRAAQEGDWAAAARALILAGEVEEDEGRMEEAEALYRQALALGRKPRDRRGEGVALLRLGRVARERGQPDNAFRHYRAALDVAEAERDEASVVTACQGLGNVCVDRGQWGEAGGWYQRGVERAGEEMPSRPLWQLFVNLAATELRQGRLEESEEWLRRGAEVAERTGDDAARVFLGSGWGRLHAALGRYDAAEASYREALGTLAPPAHHATVLVNLAEALTGQGRLGEAAATARELERLVLVHQLSPLLPYAYRALGAVARAAGDPEGFVFFEQALELCRRPGVPVLETAITQREYALLELSRGDRDSAAARLREAEAILVQLGAAAELVEVRRDLAAATDHNGDDP